MSVLTAFVAPSSEELAAQREISNSESKFTRSDVPRPPYIILCIKHGSTCTEP